MTRPIGELIEGIAVYGWPVDVTPAERAAMIDYACGFEENNLTRDEWEALSDERVANHAYWVMAEYASGQI